VVCSPKQIFEKSDGRGRDPEREIALLLCGAIGFAKALLLEPCVLFRGEQSVHGSK
jgi:hypothetical protein